MVTDIHRAMCGWSRCGDFIVFWWGLPQLGPLPRNERSHWHLFFRCSRCGDYTPLWWGLPQLRPPPRNEHAHWQSAGVVQLISVRRFHCVLVGLPQLSSATRMPSMKRARSRGSPREMCGCSRCGDFAAFWWGLSQLGPLPRNEHAHWQPPGDVELFSVRRFRCVLVGFAATWTPSTKRACSLAVPGRCAAALSAAISLRSGGVRRNFDPLHETSVLTASPRAMCSCSRYGDVTAVRRNLAPELGSIPYDEHAH